MGFLLKIVEGPNKGAEIALPEGVSVTLGKGDSCDIVLADATLPDEATILEAKGDVVTVAGEALEPFLVKTLGATSFAVGPADAPWGELKWPERDTESRRGAEAAGAAEKTRGEEGSRTDAEAQSKGEDEGKKLHGCLGCLVVPVVLLLALAALGWFFREEAKPYVEKAKPYVARGVGVFSRSTGESGNSEDAGNPAAARSVDTFEALAERYGLVLTNRAGRTALVGDFSTRAERLSATAEAYAAQPGVELDFSDGESLKTAAEDTLSLVGEKGLRVAAATNRVLVLSGAASDLRRTLEALSADLPKLRNVDVSGISLAARNAEITKEEVENAERNFGTLRPLRSLRPNRESPAAALPVCGILTTPYPCLVLRNGARVMEGAPFGDSVILKIEADSVTLTNATGKFRWKP